MGKAVLTNRIYLDFTIELYSKVKEELTYKIPNKQPQKPPKIIKLFSVIGANKVISIPAGRMDLIPKDYEVIDRRAVVPANFPSFKFKLREDQQVVFDKVNESCLINANPSWGKTFTGIALAEKLGQKTLVIVHTVALRDQWVDEIKKTLGILPGIIGSGKFDIDAPIVVGNIQTLRKHTKNLADEFGTVIVDEVHHAPSKIFTETMNSLRATHKIGLSGTLQRKDHMHVVLTDYFSPKIVKSPKNNQMLPNIHIYKTDIPFNSNPMVPWAIKVNELCERADYKELVYGLTKAYAERGHKVLVVSDRTEFLTEGHEACPDSVLVTGKVTCTEERKALLKDVRSGDKKIIFGAISIFKEGISEDHLSCLILASQINNDPLLEQLVGRVQRIQENKLEPVVVDIVLKGDTARRQAYSRSVFYSRQDWPCKLIELN